MELVDNANLENATYRRSEYIPIEIGVVGYAHYIFCSKLGEFFNRVL